MKHSDLCQQVMTLSAYERAEKEWEERKKNPFLMKERTLDRLLKLRKIIASLRKAEGNL